MAMRRAVTGEVAGGGAGARVRTPLYTPAFLLLTLTVTISYLGVGFVLPLRALYGEQIGASSFEIGLMASVALLTGFFAAPPIGALADRIGQRTVLWAGLLVHGLLVLAYIPVRDPWLLIGLRGLEGIAIVGILPPARALVNAIAPGDRQGEALGTLGSAQMVGLMLGPALGTLLASQVSYGAAFLIAAVPLFAGAGLARLYLPAGQPGISVESRGSAAGAPAWRGLFTPRLTLAYALTAALSLTTGVISATWAIYMRLRGASLPMIGLSYTTFAITALVLAPIAGRVSDRRGRFWPLVAAFALYAALYCTYATPISAVWLIVISAVEGISGAVARSAADGLLADVTPAAVRGRVQANYGAASTGGAFLMATLAGLLYGVSPGLPYLVVGVAFALGTLILVLPPVARLFPERAVASPSLERELESLERV